MPEPGVMRAYVVIGAHGPVVLGFSWSGRAVLAHVAIRSKDSIEAPGCCTYG